MFTFIDYCFETAHLAVFAGAFALIYYGLKTLSVVNAMTYTGTAYVALTAQRLGFDLITGAIIATAGAAGAVLFVEEFIHRPLDSRGGDGSSHLLASFGLYTAITELFVLLFGPQAQVIRYGIGNAFHIRVLGTVVLGLTFSGLGLWVHRTHTGLRLRALSSNRTLAETLGIDIKLLRRIVFSMSAIALAPAALLGAFDHGFDAHRGLPELLQALVCAVVAGRLQFVHILFSAMCLSGLRILTVVYISSSWADAIPFLALAVLLVVAPGRLVGLGISNTRVDA